MGNSAPKPDEPIDAGHVRVLKGHKLRVTSVTVSPDSRMIASGSVEDAARLWDVAKGKMLHKLRHDDTVNAVDFHPGGQPRLLTGCHDGTVWEWDTVTGQSVRVVATFKGLVVTALRWVPGPGGAEPKEFVVGFRDLNNVEKGPEKGRVQLCRLDTGAVIRTFDTGGIAPSSVRLTPDGSRITYSLFDCTVTAELATGKRVSKVTSFGMDACWSRDGMLLATGDVLDIEIRRGDQIMSRCKGHTAPARAFEFAIKDRLLVSVSDDATCRVWDVASGTRLQYLADHKNDVTSCCVAPNASFFVSASADYSVRIWPFNPNFVHPKIAPPPEQKAEPAAAGAEAATKPPASASSNVIAALKEADKKLGELERSVEAAIIAGPGLSGK